MGAVVPFPEPVREVVVVQVYSHWTSRKYALVIIDPEIGEIRPTQYSNKVKIREMIEALHDDAVARRLDFEVHDLSTKQNLYISNNDNG